METNKILNADVLDIIFDGRNKLYGAYELRKTYNKRLKRSLAVMLGFSLLVIGGSVLANGDNNKRQAQIIVQDLSLSNVKEEKVIPPPVIPPPKKEEIKVEMIKSTPPLIVTEKVTEIPPKQTDMDDVTIGTINQAGIRSDVVAPPVEEKGTGKIEAPVKEMDYDSEFKTVQIQASFPDGADGWIKYLKRNLRQEVPVDNGAPAGDYPVIVSFLVDKDGNVTEVKAETNPGYGTAEEAIRVIQRSGKWKPAIQNGRNVIYRQRQQITFQVSDNQ